MPPTTALSTLEQQKADVLASLADWPADRLTHRPTPTSWCAVEVLDHIVKVEREILVAARRGLASPRRRGIGDRIRGELLDWLFRSDRRVRAPTSVPEVLPAPGTDMAIVRRDWDVSRRELAAFLAPLTAEQLVPGVFRHPVAGWMSVPGVLRFFWVHTHHHRFQLMRLRASAADP